MLSKNFGLWTSIHIFLLAQKVNEVILSPRYWKQNKIINLRKIEKLIDKDKILKLLRKQISSTEKTKSYSLRQIVKLMKDQLVYFLNPEAYYGALFLCGSLLSASQISAASACPSCDFCLLNCVWCDLEIPSNAVNWGHHRTHPTYLLFLPELSPAFQCLKTDVLFALHSVW